MLIYPFQSSHCIAHSLHRNDFRVGPYRHKSKPGFWNAGFTRKESSSRPQKLALYSQEVKSLSMFLAGLISLRRQFPILVKIIACFPIRRDSELIWETSELCGNTGGCYRAGQDKATRIFDYKVFRPYWQITINGYITRVSITLLRSVESRLPQEQTENHDYPRVLNVVHRDEAVVVLRKTFTFRYRTVEPRLVPTPAGTAPFHAGPRAADLGHIRFTDQLKKLNSPYQWMPFSYRDDVPRILHLWKSLPESP